MNDTIEQQLDMHVQKTTRTTTQKALTSYQRQLGLRTLLALENIENLQQVICHLKQ